MSNLSFVKLVLTGAIAAGFMAPALAATEEPKKLYLGDVQPDQALALVTVGWINGPWNRISHEQVVAYLAGVDGEMCPKNEGNGGGVPYCGLFVQMTPGDKRLTVRLSHSATTAPIYQGSVSRFQQDYRELSVSLQKDTIYRLVPSRSADGSLEVALEEVCKGKAHNSVKVQFVLRDARKDSGPGCP